MISTTCDHKACRSVDLTTAGIYLAPATAVAGRREYIAVHATSDDRFLGSVQDDGHAIHPNHGGGWRHRYAVTAGGNGVCLDENTWVDGTWHRTDENLTATLAAFVEWCGRVSFAWRMALHG
jgi:hypothetical protein